MAKRKKKKKKIPYWLIGLITLLAVIYFFPFPDLKDSKPVSEIKKYFIPEDLSSKSMQIDQAIIEKLVNLGIQDKDVLEEYREEKENFGKKWIVVNRTIQIPEGKLIEDYQYSLTKELEKHSAKVTGEIKNDNPGNISHILTVTIKDIIIEKLIFIKKKLSSKKIAIIIDDWGNFYKKGKEFFKINAPLTFAILPKLTYSRQIAEEAHNNNFEIMLHFPMEAHPHDYKEKKTGPGAIYANMSSAEIEQVLEENLKSVPYAKGVNNHMGSKITEDTKKMKILLNILKSREMYFIDSLVTNKSVAEKTGREINMKIGARDIFLDNKDNPAYIKSQISKLISIALKQGSAIGIGHVERKHTADVIKNMLPFIESKGIKIVPVSQIIE